MQSGRRSTHASSTAPPTREELLNRYMNQAGSDESARARASGPAYELLSPSHDLAILFDHSPVSARWATSLRRMGSSSSSTPRWVRRPGTLAQQNDYVDPLRVLLKQQLWKNFQMAQTATGNETTCPQPSPRSAAPSPVVIVHAAPITTIPASFVHVARSPLPRSR